MELWIIFIILYGVFKGLREPIKKKALEKNGVLETLFLYVFLGFLMCIPFSGDALLIQPKFLVIILIKSSVIFAAWIAAFISVKKLPVSLYGIMDTSRVIFSTLLGILILGEALTAKGTVGLLLVVVGIYLVNTKKSGERAEIKIKYLLAMFISCALNAVSGTIDKIVMMTGEITSSQLQFWFMLLLSLMYYIYIRSRGEKVNFRTGLKNPCIYLMSGLLIFGDRLLFMANSDPASKVTLMTVIKQSSVVVTILSGMIIYKEKNILFKLMCAAIVIAGILMVVL